MFDIVQSSQFLILFSIGGDDYAAAGTGPSPPGINYHAICKISHSAAHKSSDVNIQTREFDNVQPSSSQSIQAIIRGSSLTMQILFPFSRILGNFVCAPV